MQNVTVTLKSTPTIIIAICCYINRQKYRYQVWVDFRVLAVQHTYVTGFAKTDQIVTTAEIQFNA